MGVIKLGLLNVVACSIMDSATRYGRVGSRFDPWQARSLVRQGVK